MIVVADSGPLYYLILLKHVEFLRRFYGQVVVARGRRQRLSNSAAPRVVRDSITAPPSWVETRPVAPDVLAAVFEPWLKP